jgi:hypothetical protein
MAVYCSVISLSKELQQRQLETKRTRVYQKIKGVLDHSPPKINENGERKKKETKTQHTLRVRIYVNRNFFNISISFRYPLTFLF